MNSMILWMSAARQHIRLLKRNVAVLKGWVGVKIRQLIWCTFLIGHPKSVMARVVDYLRATKFHFPRTRRGAVAKAGSLGTKKHVANDLGVASRVGAAPNEVV